MAADTGGGVLGGFGVKPVRGPACCCITTPTCIGGELGGDGIVCHGIVCDGSPAGSDNSSDVSVPLSSNIALAASASEICCKEVDILIRK